MDDIDRRLLNDFQRNLPLTSRPYAAMAEALEISEREVMDRLETLITADAISRVGAVIRPNSVGVSTLAAIAVPAERLDEVADVVSAFSEVNHNYEREHDFNLWFVVTAPDQGGVDSVLSAITEATGMEVIDLPLSQAFHIDLGFPLQWK